MVDHLIICDDRFLFESRIASKIVIPDDCQDTSRRLDPLKLLEGHDVTRCSTPARGVSPLPR